jgi:hypothetical protein
MKPIGNSIKKGAFMMKEKTIDEIIKEEWLQFQRIHNRGGRAGCQDDWEQFEIMRKSQFMAWPESILDSYYDDLLSSQLQGRNLLFEKYAWMMESTSPEEFREIRRALPAITWIRRNRINRTAFIQARWGEAFASEYPSMAGSGRVFYTQDDKPWSTSIETYTRGELLSYSEKTEAQYSDFILSHEEEGVNLTKAVRENMVRLYGYPSLEHYENMLREGK